MDGGAAQSKLTSGFGVIAWDALCFTAGLGNACVQQIDDITAAVHGPETDAE